MDLSDHLKLIRDKLPHELINACFREHSRLSFRMQKLKCGKEVQATLEGYFYNAIPIAALEWDETKGNATTALFNVVQRLIMRDIKNQNYAGSVRVPYGNEKYLGCSIDEFFNSADFENDVDLENENS